MIKGDDMDPLANLPRIAQNDLLQRASKFADEMVRRLEEFNQTHPFPLSPGITETEWQKIKDAMDAMYPSPKDIRALLEEIFLSYMKERYTIIPDP